ncbi:sulfatase family protein [Conexibacter arvalis]|uniref:Arylsulfatase A-like enzyme n=1 Tax=Conexibacter arvalis TaxID=912552 RepID=A0A840IG68_9ACTN|nr:sulfatase [Conexibacter arvalis]MBB4662958.1 arylsulfatase A-like enzyme [Conexibacter arvalis]
MRHRRATLAALVAAAILCVPLPSTAAGAPAGKASAAREQAVAGKQVAAGAKRAAAQQRALRRAKQPVRARPSARAKKLARAKKPAGARALARAKKRARARIPARAFPRSRAKAPARRFPLAPPSNKPNIVFVLTDDLSWDLVDYMPNVKRLQREGVTFSNYIVTNSLCCPSRASILTGRYPHNTGIYRNTGDDGGFLAFRARGQERDTFATSLQQAGYRTALMGKYMNQYNPTRVRDALGRPYVPPGWTDWKVVGNGYPGYGYRIAREGRVVRRGWEPRDYLTTVLRRDAIGFISSAVGAGQPFMLELSTFTPHTPSTPAPRDVGRFSAVTAPRTPSFNEEDISDKPSWLRGHRRLTDEQQQRIDEHFRNRVRSVQSVDRAIGRIRRELNRLGVARNTYVVFSSDNGFHMGQHRLTPGKLTAYDPDIRVPLVVTGPGVPAGRVVSEIAENVDLCPTFTELGGTPAPATADGRSLVPFLRGLPAPADWRRAALIEHRGAVTSPADPDFPARGSGNPPTYEALRTRDSLYVEYADGEREFYDRRVDPDELDNVYDALPEARRERLTAAVAAMKTCTGVGCRVASRLGAESPLP